MDKKNKHTLINILCTFFNNGKQSLTKWHFVVCTTDRALPSRFLSNVLNICIGLFYVACWRLTADETKWPKQIPLQLQNVVSSLVLVLRHMKWDVTLCTCAAIHSLSTQVGRYGGNRLRGPYEPVIRLWSANFDHRHCNSRRCCKVQPFRRQWYINAPRRPHCKLRSRLSPEIPNGD